MRNFFRKVFLSSLIIFPILVFGQNIVIQVSGSVLINSNKGYVSLKKGDNISNSSRLKFVKDNKKLRPEVKMITPKGICLIGYKDYEKNTSYELLDLVKASIHKNSVATLGTRSLGATPSFQEQVRIVDSLCKILRANKDNIDYIVTTYINPYCVSEFVNPYWSNIGEYLFTNYGLKLVNRTGNSF